MIKTRPDPGRRYGGVPVSTGIVRPEQRAEVPDLFKPGNFLKLTDTNTVALAA